MAWKLDRSRNNQRFTMKFGVNYTPSHGWFHAWLDPDWDASTTISSRSANWVWTMCASSRSGRICNLIALGSTRRAWRMCAAWCTRRRARFGCLCGRVPRAICPASTSCLHGWSPGMRATCSPMRTPLRPSVELVKTMTDELSKNPRSRALPWATRSISCLTGRILRR